jgi:hypothetical protein
MVIHAAKRELLDVVDALGSTRSFTSGLNRWQ